MVSDTPVEVEEKTVEVDDSDSTEDQVEAPETPPTPDELLAANPDLQKILDEKVVAAREAGENSGADKAQRDLRRAYADPARTGQALTSLAQEVADNNGEVTQSTQAKATNLMSEVKASGLDEVAAEIPAFFFEKYEFPQDVMSDYQAKFSRSEVDGALQTLFTDVERQIRVDVESAFESKLATEVDKRVKAELDTKDGDSSSPPPAPRGNASRGNGLMLTSAELGHPQFATALRNLDQKQRDTVYANVPRADEQFGAENVREAAFESLKVLGQTS